MDLKDYIKLEWNLNNQLFKFRVIPNAKETQFEWIMDNWVLKIRLKTVPEKWKANKALIDFISENLWVKKSSIEIVSWLTDKNKIVKIDF